jgi:predicted nuclease of predicted toxin-antitoxin system
VRVLLDESLPRRLSRLFETVEVETVLDRGWGGLKNGELLRRAEADFDAFVTADQSLPHQQNVAGFSLRIVVLAAPTNRMEDLEPLVPAVLERLESIREGESVVVRSEAR